MLTGKGSGMFKKKNLVCLRIWHGIRITSVTVVLTKRIKTALFPVFDASIYCCGAIRGSFLFTSKGGVWVQDLDLDCNVGIWVQDLNLDYPAFFLLIRQLWKDKEWACIHNAPLPLRLSAAFSTTWYLWCLSGPTGWWSSRPQVSSPLL